MGPQTMQTTSMNHWDACHTAASGMTVRCSGLLSYLALLTLTLGLVSCAASTERRADLLRLQSDLDANRESLAQLSARLEALERRQSPANSAAESRQQELAQAIEVLLKKALLTDSRLSAIESGGVPTIAPQKPAKRAQQSSSLAKASVA